MSRGSNRRKLVEPTITVGSTSSSGNTAESDNAANADSLTYFINITTATAGSITFVIQSSADDGTTWCDLATAEMSGDTGALTTTGGKHISTYFPFGTRTRLKYTIVTGPFAFTVIPIYQKAGSVY